MALAIFQTLLILLNIMKKMDVCYEIFLKYEDSDKTNHAWIEAKGTLMIEVKGLGAKYSCEHTALSPHGWRISTV